MIRRVLQIILPVLLGVGPLCAGEAWIETTYFVPGFKADLKMPTTDPAWKIYSRKKILVGKNARGVECLDGSEKGAASWETGNFIVSILPSGETSISPKAAGGTLLDGDVGDAAWIKNLPPWKEEKWNGLDLLIYDTGNGYRRAWIVADSSRPLALVNGKFITFYEEQPDASEVTVPEAVVKALKKRKSGEAKIGEMGAMPQ